MNQDDETTAMQNFLNDEAFLNGVALFSHGCANEQRIDFKFAHEMVGDNSN